MNTTVGWAVALAVLTAGAYAAFLGWDDEYQVDSVTGVATGPYEAWQVIGLGAICAFVAGVAGWYRTAAIAVIVMPVVLVIGFVVSAIGDGSAGDGLFVVGALLLGVGSLLGVGLVAFVTQAWAASHDLL